MICSCQKIPLYSFLRFVNGLLALLCQIYGNPVFTPNPKWSQMTYKDVNHSVRTRRFVGEYVCKNRRNTECRKNMNGWIEIQIWMVELNNLYYWREWLQNRKRIYLHTPTSPHIIIATNGLAISHESKVHGRTDQITVECQIHSTHWKEGGLWYRQNCVNVPMMWTYSQNIRILEGNC